MVIFYTLLLLFSLVLFARWIKRKEKEWIGKYGEYKVRKVIENIESSSPNIKTFHNLYIPKQDGSMSQIDHIILSNQGLFVIETKNYNGWILGNETSKYWMQVIYKRKEKFLNPILQNKGHVKALKNWLGKEFSHVPIYSIVVFLPRAKLKFNTDFSQAAVVYPYQLKQVMEQQKTNNIDWETSRRLAEKLTSILVKDKRQERIVKKQHVQAIQANKKRREMS
ncbi:NERD nuclease [Anoxybacillus ayderensis]|uniref:nuclease-related domain-containing protein n=1 Tax=Anoxybacillus gonensis TaxID=198467 RepID=UPI0002C01415|nr:nuclease-related domain-containing protein [Anoxybacillus gonensis]AXM87785.1 NERD domain-containing protein [Anoxybacillus ayderensis G10]EMI11448.1 NERD domain-containing protein [Anoxybacillus gonensis]THD17003.1 NERD nuclease [Anoxybacillus ayderensis]